MSGVLAEGSTADPAFAHVVEAFEAGFRHPENPELGAALCVHVRGRKVVDLWGGWRDAAKTRPWTADTLSLTMSATKGLAALVVHILAEQGRIDLDAPVTRYWPEFARGGKDGVLVSHVLLHTAGVPLVADGTTELGVSHEAWVRALEAAPLRHPPGEVCWYLTLTQGFLLGELVRRVTGRSLGAMARELVTEPLGADYHIGLTAQEQLRAADFLPQPEQDLQRLAHDPPPDNLLLAAVAQLGQETRIGSAAFRAGEVPASNGYASARGLSRIYAALANGGELDGVRIAAREAVARMGALVGEFQERVTGLVWPRSLGFFKHCDFTYFRGSPSTFGHPGNGGTTGFCDPESGLAFGYVLNAPPKIRPGDLSRPRLPPLVDAVHACL